MAGSLILTTSGVAGKSGSPQRVTAIVITSDGTAGVTTLRNGTSSGAAAVVSFTGSINLATAPANFPADGINFPAGLYVSMDGHSTQVTLTIEQLATV